MAWRKGQAWRVVRSLDTLDWQIRAAYPRAVPPATPVNSWGALADNEHDSSSDHYPHYYSVLGSTAVVCARDFPHAPALGLDAHALAERLRQSRDPRIGYIISNGRETGPHHNWQWDRYDGDDPHDTHIHVSTVHTAAADNTREWQIGHQAGEDDDMPDFGDKLQPPVPGDPGATLGWTLNDLNQMVAQLFLAPDKAKVAQGTLKPEPKSVLDVLVTAAKRPAVTLTDADRADIAAKVLAGLPAALADQLAADLAARLAK